MKAVFRGTRHEVSARRTPVLITILGLALVFGLVACGNGDAASSGSASDSGSQRASVVTGDAALTDPCGVLTPDEVATAIGDNDGGHVTAGSTCIWTAKAKAADGSDISMQLEIGDPGSSATTVDQGPLPADRTISGVAEGYYSPSLGQVEMRCLGDRDCAVAFFSGLDEQVPPTLSDGTHRQAVMHAIAVKVGTRIP